MEKKKRVFTVLAIDGGGVRGIVPARVLQEIEERTGKPACELFDMIGGFSTGAIVATGLTVPDDNNPSKPKFTAKQMKEFYFEYAQKIFPEMAFKSLRQLSSTSVYDPKPLEAVLEKHFGDARMNESLTHLFIAATDIKNFKPVLIRHIKGEKDTTPEGWSSMLYKEAVRATTTAPTYFPAKYYQTNPNPDMPIITHRHALIDGGFFGGHMMRRMLTQAKKIAPPDADIVVVHIGTGNIDNSLSPDEYNKLGPLGLLSKSKGSIILTLAMNMTTHDVAADLKDEIGDRFISFNGYIKFQDKKNSPSAPMDDASTANLKKLEKFAEEVIADNDLQLQRLCALLEQRSLANDQHVESRAALKRLTEILEEVKTVKSLTKLYRKILRHASEIPDARDKGDEDIEIRDLVSKLTDKHKEDLDRIYNVLQDKLENQNGVLNSIKETGDNLNKFFKKIGGPFNENAKKDNGANDNDKKPPAAAHINNKKKKGPGWF